MQKMRLTNYFDAERLRLGQIAPSDVRSIEVDAIVDTGATTLILPADVVNRLGLPVVEMKQARLADNSLVPCPRVGGLQIEILGRGMFTSALVMPAGSLPLIGQIPLEELDLVVDPRNQSLRPNPSNPDGRIVDVRRAAA